MILRLLLYVLFARLAVRSAFAQTSTPAPTSASITSAATSRGSTGNGTSTSSSSTGSSPTASTDPDVVLHVPNLSVGRIELDVDNLQADVNLAAKVAGLVTINAGVAVSIEKVNLTISEVKAELDLVVRLGHLVDIVNRVFQSLDLNPLLITAISNVTDVLDTIVGEVDGLLGSVTSGGNTLSFLVDNLGNIVQQVAGAGGDLVNTIVGDYKTNMTFTGKTEQLGQGLVQKVYKYEPLNALVNIVFNAAGNIVQAFASKQSSTTSSATTSKATARI